MSKKRKRFDDRQTSIFELLNSVRDPKPEKNPVGSHKIVDELRDSLRDAIKSCPLSRHQIAGEMSHLLDEGISKAQIDSWTRATNEDGSPNVRHIPAEYLPAFCAVTKDDTPIKIQADKIERYLLPPTKAIDAEIAKALRKKEEQAQLIRRLKLLRDEVDR